MFTNAIARKPGPDFASGLTTAEFGEPNYELLQKQHKAYLNALQELGLQIDLLEPLSGYPDAYFVEDVAVVIDEIAVVTRPGAQSRAGETEYIVSTLEKYRPLTYIQPPGTLDGGDVMMAGRRCFVGISARTNIEGAAQLGHILHRHGFEWMPVSVKKGLHLKSDVNYIGQNTLLLSGDMAKLDIFDSFEQIIVSTREAHAANSVLVNDRLITPLGYPQTKSQLLDRGFKVLEMDTSEVRKMDGGLSCLSLRF